MENSGRERKIKNASQTSSGVEEIGIYETGSRNGSTLSEGVGLVKPIGLSGKVVIGFPVNASCGKLPEGCLDSGARNTL
jgi:hypothetical protein